jgi:hypothetical protein
MKKFNQSIYRTLKEQSANKEAKTFTTYDEKLFQQLNDSGNGIYYSPQSYKGPSNKKEYLLKINTLFADLDVAKTDDGQLQEEIEIKKNNLISALRELHLQPSAIVSTRNGLQPYWYIDLDEISAEVVERCERVIKGISQWATKFGSLGDPVHDIVHLLRVPNFNHHKKEPYMVHIVSENDAVFTLAELETAFPYTEPIKTKRIEQSGNEAGGDLIEQVNKLDIRDVAIRAWEHKGSTASFDKNNHLIVDGVVTATFANREGGNFIATSSSEYPADGNAVTYVAETLDISTKEAFRWIVTSFDLKGRKGQIQAYKPLPEVTSSLKTLLHSIPTDTPKDELATALEPLLNRIAKELGPADGESFVGLTIKKYFSLTGVEVSGFVKKLRELNPDNKQKREREPSQAECLLELIEKEEVEFFVDETRTPFARVKVNNHFETLPIKSKTFQLWAIGLYHKQMGGRAINSDAYQTARGLIENKCLFDGKQYVIHPRVARDNEVIWYDLCDSDWRAVRVDENGWQIVNNPPILFRRYPHMYPQVEPRGSCDIREIFKFINVENEEMQLLLMVWIVSCFIKGFPHTAPIIHGQQGSAKTTASEILKAIIDPSVMRTSRLPHDTKEAVQMLAHSWFTIFDNVSPEKFSGSMSDLFCTVVTGGGVSKRELYSDDEDIIYNLQRVIGINGIVIVANKPDLLDRSILIDLARIPKDKRKTANQVWEEFESIRPALLGGIFDTLVQAIRIKPTLKFDSLPRMADFAEWGSAIAIALGSTQEEFMKYYLNNIKQQSDNVISDSLVATLVLGLCDRMKGEEWEGSASELLEEIGKDSEGDIDEKTRRHTDFPKASNVLSRTLNEMKTTLAEAGCYVWQTGTNRKKWHISKLPEKAPQDSLLLSDDSDVQDFSRDITGEQEIFPSLVETYPVSNSANDDDF